MKQKDFRACSEGFIVTYEPSKQTAQTKTKSFIIPKGIYASMIESYLDALYKHFDPKPDDPFFFTGRRATKSGPSKFVRSPLGINEMRKTGVFIAECLELDEPKRFTGKILIFLFLNLCNIVILILINCRTLLSPDKRYLDG